MGGRNVEGGRKKLHLSETNMPECQLVKREYEELEKRSPKLWRRPEPPNLPRRPRAKEGNDLEKLEKRKS